MTNIETAAAARNAILEAVKNDGRDEIMGAIVQWNNTTDNDIGEDGGVWVSNPQAGHWLNDDRIVEFANFINAR